MISGDYFVLCYWATGENDHDNSDFNITEISTNLHTKVEVLYDTAPVYSNTGQIHPLHVDSLSLWNNATIHLKNMNARLRACWQCELIYYVKIHLNNNNKKNRLQNHKITDLNCPSKQWLLWGKELPESGDTFQWVPPFVEFCNMCKTKKKKVFK